MWDPYLIFYIYSTSILFGMDTKNIAIGLVVGVLIGTLGIYAVDLSRFSQLNKQIESLDDQIASQQEVIDTQEEAIIMVDALTLEVNTSRTLIKQYEEYMESADALKEKLREDYNILNVLCALQTYKLEEALTELNQSEIEFSFVYGDLSFEDWWEINKGPLEEWWSIVYG